MPFEQVGVRHSGRLLVSPGSGLQEKPLAMVVRERFQAKTCPGLDPGWRPVCVKKTRQINNPEPRFDSIETERALALATAS
jgi:hypothetical protein